MKSTTFRAFLASLSIIFVTNVSASAACFPEPACLPEPAAGDSLLPRTNTPLLLPMPLQLTARDFVTKVYGVFSPELCQDSIVGKARAILNLTPDADEYGLWLEDANGYSVSYYGMRPDVSALACFDNNSVSDFSFFFLFPYSGSDKRDEANSRQAEFCGALLQELADIGVTLGADASTDAMFEVSGDYAGNFVEMRLIEEESGPGRDVVPDRAGRFVVTLSVEPGSFTPADNIVAATE